MGCSTRRERVNNQSFFFLSPHPSGTMCPRPPIIATIITIKAQWPEYNQQTALDLQLVASRNKLLHLRATASLNLLLSSPNAECNLQIVFFLYLEITLTLQVCYFSEAYRLGLWLTFFLIEHRSRKSMTYRFLFTQIKIKLHSSRGRCKQPLPQTLM